jgi:hypothetical protein
MNRAAPALKLNVTLAGSLNDWSSCGKADAY